MSEKKPPAGDAGERNVDQIRDILFGGQMRDYERRFQELNQRLEQDAARLRADIEKRFAALEKRLDDQVEKLARSIRQEIADRGKAVEELEARGLQAARTARNETNAAIEQLEQELARADERNRGSIAEAGSALARFAAETQTALAKAREELRGDKVGREDLAALFAELALRLKGEFDLPTKK
jgi:hypothetical protein